jgi:hypothetical protein
MRIVIIAVFGKMTYYKPIGEVPVERHIQNYEHLIITGLHQIHRHCLQAWALQSKPQDLY